MTRALLEIPQASPLAGYLTHQEEIDSAIRQVLARGQYILGEEVAAFEREFAGYLGVKHGVGVGSGTDALELALRAVGAGPGDFVFTVSHTAVATVAAIESVGAIPVFVDIDGATFTMDPDRLAKAVEGAKGGCPRAVIPVHLYGHPAALPDIVAVARRYGLYVIEDCAQAHGAVLHGKKTGTWGDLAAFSFYPTKNLGALGDGGLVATDNPDWANQVQRWRQYGWRERFVSETPGRNSRLDELQAAVLRVKLKYLDDENVRRRQIAAAYSQQLGDTGLLLPVCRQGAQHVFHQYVVQSSVRDSLRAWLGSHGVGTAIHYGRPVHEQPAYAGRLGAAVPLPLTEQAARQVLSLPMYPGLTDQQVGRVAKLIRTWSQERGI